MKISLSARLRDIGERRLISEILWARYGRRTPEAFGQDCAFLHQRIRPDEILVATTDPCPMPMAWILGFTDFYYYGWLLGTINLSDVAASGARPLGFLNSLVLPSSVRVRDLIRLLDGLDSVLALSNTKVIGGNLKEDIKVAAHGTAFGVVRKDLVLRRDTARPRVSHR